MDPIRVLIADDHPVFRFGLRALLGAEPDTDVVGEATTGDDAVRFVSSLQPDVVLMDVNMPGINGIEATRRIVETAPNVRVIMLTMFDDDDSVFAAMRAGARGYLLKGAEGDETVHAIRVVAGGEAIFSPAVARRLVQFFGPQQPSGSPAFPQLTERERDILTLVAEGYTNSAVAERLGIGAKTVRNYVSSIFDKLQVAGRAEAIARARSVGMTGKSST
jgi:DNA-binding NarL/FixJ family response regulator